MEETLKTASAGGTTIHYKLSGEGPLPVILMHGWGCDHSTVAVLEKAAADTGNTTVYNLDLPGFGASPEPPEVWGVEMYTRAVEDFVKKTGLKRPPVLIGHSFGGRIAILYASRNPVEKLILVDAAGIKPRRGINYYARVYAFKSVKKLLPLLLGRSAATRIIDRWRGSAGSADYASASPRMRAILSKVVNEDLKAEMPKIKAPALLIWGENDTATPLSDAKTMERLIPDAGLVAYPGCGHYSFLDNPGQTRAVIASFLS